jgi:hypothetical protein
LRGVPDAGEGLAHRRDARAAGPEDERAARCHEVLGRRAVDEQQSHQVGEHGSKAPDRKPAAASARTREPPPLSSAWRREAAVASGSMSEATTGGRPRRARHRQERRPRADVERTPERAPVGEALERFQAELRRLVGSGAEGAAGVDDQPLRRRSGRLPARDDLEAPDAEGAKTLAEARHPVDLRHGYRLDRSTGQRAREPDEVGIVAEVGHELHAALALGSPRRPACGVPEGGRGFVFTGRVEDHAQSACMRRAAPRLPAEEVLHPVEQRLSFVLEVRHRQRLGELLEAALRRRR